MYKINLLTNGKLIKIDSSDTKFKAQWIGIQWEWVNYNNNYKIC